MKRLAAGLIALAALASAWPALPSDSPDLTDHRKVSCSADAFKPVFSYGVQTGYRSDSLHAAANIHVGQASLEWCMAAQNAAIYFYVDDPKGPQHRLCPENMSLAVFPGRGPDAHDIIEANAPSYRNPAVTLVEGPTIKPVTVISGARSIETFQLDAVTVDTDGRHRRQRMIGYARDNDFVRVMTSAVDDPFCLNAATRSFMDKLVWP